MPASMVAGGTTSKKRRRSAPVESNSRSKSSTEESRESPPPPIAAEAGGPCYKRRMRSAALITARASEALNSTKSAPEEDQEPLAPPAVDRISHLPDAVLGSIISLLPVKEGARTQILASPWRRLWRSAPLNLDCGALLTDLSTSTAAPSAPLSLDAGVVSRVLDAHRGPGRRFCVRAQHPSFRAAAADAWLRAPALNGLEELELRLGACRRLDPPPLPAPVFRFAPTLRVATFGVCHIPDSAAQASLHFPNLKQLALEHVIVSECSLHRMLAGCPVLECLLIKRAYGFRSVRINSPTLRSIGVLLDPSLPYPQKPWELVIENAPALRTLLNLEEIHTLHVSVVSAPKLESLGCLSDGPPGHHPDYLSRLVLGSTTIHGLGIDTLATVVRTVKVLALIMHTLSLDKTIELMRCFPCLESLFIQSSKRGKSNCWRRKHRTLAGSLHIPLKTIVWQGYWGTTSHVNFATFFIRTAKVLESMTFQVEAKHCIQEFIAQQSEELNLESRASTGAKFRFTSNRCLRSVSDIKHAADLDLLDPFSSRC